MSRSRGGSTSRRGCGSRLHVFLAPDRRPHSMGREAVEHIVLFKVTRNFTESEVAGLMSLKQIPGVLSISCGPNYTARGRGYNYGALRDLPNRVEDFIPIQWMTLTFCVLTWPLATGAVVRFESMMAAAAYQSHPVHVRQLEVIKGVLQPDPEAVLALDYVFELKECPIDWRGFVLIGAAFGAIAALAAFRK